MSNFDCNLNRGHSQKDLGPNYDQILITRLIGVTTKKTQV